MSNLVIKVENLSKRYRIGLKEKKAETLIGQVGNLIKSPWQNLKRLRQMNRFGLEDESVFWALKDVSFEVKEGEILGIIGKNGAGKSTLLKILSQITEPTSGKIEIHGRVASLLEVGTGFHPELSGRENIFMNGTILGMTRREIVSKLDEIIDFSGVEKFIDTPVKFYSSGMKVRLGFSVAAHLDPEILIIDEVLAVGDFEFQAKCLGKMEDVSRNQGRTVLFVSHNMGAISSLCTRSLVLQNGVVGLDGSIADTLTFYLNTNEKIQYRMDSKYKDIKLSEFILKNTSKVSCLNIAHDQDFFICLNLYSTILIKNSIISLVLYNQIFDRISTIHIKPILLDLGINQFEILVEGGNIVPGSYFFNLHIHDEYETYFLLENARTFNVYDNGSDFYKWNGQDIGKVFLKYKRC